MLLRVWQWMKAVLRRWFAWIGVALTLIPPGSRLSQTLQNEVQGPIADVLIALGIALLLIAAFRAWNEEREVADELRATAKVALDRPPTIVQMERDAVLIQAHLRNLGLATADEVYLLATFYIGDKSSKTGRGLIIGTLHPNQEHESPVRISDVRLQEHTLARFQESKTEIACTFTTTYAVGTKKYSQQQEAKFDYSVDRFVLTHQPRVEVIKSTVPLRTRAKRAWNALRET
jgi:hypothetical protein